MGDFPVHILYYTCLHKKQYVKINSIIKILKREVIVMILELEDNIKVLNNLKQKLKETGESL